MPHNILLTGRPGVGKTTLILRLLEAVQKPASGFYTRELREQGTRLGFEAVRLDGRRTVLAHVGMPSSWRVGKYYVQLPAFEAEILPAIELEALPAPGILVIDEIGRMECLSSRFRQAVQRALDANVPVLGTVGLQDDPFLRAVRSRPDVRLITVTPENRDRLVREIAAWMEEKGW
ncbi:MAG: NTPase [Anaerolineae bacterium]